MRSIYRRRVIFPSSDMLISWTEYLEWEVDPSEIEKISERHTQAEQKLDAMVAFEERFQGCYIVLD